MSSAQATVLGEITDLLQLYCDEADPLAFASVILDNEHPETPSLRRSAE